MVDGYDGAATLVKAMRHAGAYMLCHADTLVGNPDQYFEEEPLDVTVEFHRGAFLIKLNKREMSFGRFD